MRALRRTIGAVGLTVATLTGVLALAQQPAQAATTWYVSPTGSNAAACTSPATACLTLPGVMSKPAFASGDTINAAPGTYPMTTAAQKATLTRSVTIQRDPAALPEAGPVVFDGGGTTGSLFFVNAAGIELTLRDLTIRNANGGTSGYGGGLLVFLGSATAENVTFADNKALLWGGAVAVWPGASFRSTGGAYTNNQAPNGGAIVVFGRVSANDQPASATVTGGTFTANRAPGGAIANAGNGGAIYSSGTTSVTGATFVDNEVLQSTNAQARRGYGGTIFSGPTDAADQPVLTLTESTIGAGTPVSVLGVHATAGGAIANLGAITGAAASDLTATDVTIEATEAYFGGALYNAGTADLVSTDIRFATAEPFAGIGGTGTGGAITNAGPLTISGSELLGNEALGGNVATTGLGGAISNAGPLTILDSVLEGNLAQGSAAESTGMGGAIYTLAATNIERTDVLGNTAAGDSTANTGRGGGIYAQAGNLTVVDSLLSENTASGDVLTSGLGGGIFTFLSTVDLTGTTLAGNDAQIGGAMYVAGSTTVTGGGVVDNEALLGAGLFNVVDLALDGVTVSGNAASIGGGIYTIGTLTGTDVELVDNAAGDIGLVGTGLGGGLYNTGTASLTGGQISGNEAFGGGAAATGLGGGIYNGTQSAKVTLDGVHLAGNAAHGSAVVFQTGWGGAIYNGANGGNNSDVVVDRSTIEGSAAVLGSDFVAYAPGANASADTAIRRSTITGGTTTVPGGASLVASSASRTTISESTLMGSGTLLAGAGNAVVGIAGSILTGTPTACVLRDAATVTDGGHNLVDVAGGAGCGLGGTTVVGDPALGGLADNGGATPTHLPGATSAALDQIDAATATGLTDVVSGGAVVLCTAADQRDVARPQGERCDIGAVEAAQAAPVLEGPASGTFTVGTAGELGAYTASGSPSPTITAEGLPDGLAFEATGPAAGRIVGTPAAGTGGVHAVTLTAANEAGSDELAVEVTVEEAPVLTGPSAIHLVETVPGDAAYSSTGYPVPTLTLEGDLPDGITFTAAPDGTATISGTAAAGTAGTYEVTVRASNGTEPDATQVVTIVVDPVLSVATTALPDGGVGVPYVAGVLAAGGTAPYTFSLVDGSLPAGLVLGADGSIAGVPQGPVGTSTFTVRVTDTTAPDAQVAERELSITIGKGPSILDVNPVILQRGPLGVNLGSVNATLRTALGTPLAGQTIVFTAGNVTVCTGVTDANGYVSCSMTVLNTVRTILNLGVTATYAGNAAWLPSSDSAGLLT